MNFNDYEKIMDAFSPDEGMRERIKNNIATNRDPQQKSCRQQHQPLRRALSAACLTILISTCMITVAFAASPKLRMAVLSFFHIGETEVLPEEEKQPPAPKTPDEPDISISDAEIGGRVKAEYIRLDGDYGMQCGLLTQVKWNDAKTGITSARFWDHENGALHETDIDLCTTAFKADWQGSSYEGTIYWFTHRGELGFYTGETRSVTENGETDWYVTSISGRTDAVLLHLAAGRQSDYREYVYLCHLATGAIEDFLAESGLEETDSAYDYTFSEDLSYARVICAGENGNPNTLLWDIKNKRRLDGYEQTGIAADSVTLTGDTLLLFSFKKDNEGIDSHVSCHACNLKTGRTALTLKETKCYRWWEESPEGVMTSGGRYCIRITKSGSTHVIDLTTGEETAIDNFTFEKGGEFSPSPSGNKFLYFTADSDTPDFHFSQLGVLDMESGSFLAFDRENNLKLEEEGIGWDSENRIILRAHTRDRETGYIILYEF